MAIQQSATEQLKIPVFLKEILATSCKKMGLDFDKLPAITDIEAAIKANVDNNLEALLFIRLYEMIAPPPAQGVVQGVLAPAQGVVAPAQAQGQGAATKIQLVNMLMKQYDIRVDIRDKKPIMRSVNWMETRASAWWLHVSIVYNKQYNCI